MTAKLRSLIAAVLTLAALANSQDEAAPPPFDAAAFEAHLRALGADAAELAAWAAHDQPALAADKLLRHLVPEYDAAVRLAEAGDPRAALALAELVGRTPDPWLRAHSRYHLGRVFLDSGDPEQALAIFALYLGEDQGRTLLDAEVLFFRATALAATPDSPAAILALRRFLAHCPNSLEAYRTSATQLLQELQARNDQPLDDLADQMQAIAGSLRQTDTGAKTQAQQCAVISTLEQLLEQAKKMEKQSAGPPSGLGQPSTPASQSSAPPGATRIGNLNGVPGVADRWGNLQEREREAIATDLQTKLPGHYRRMLEDYYRKLGR